MKINAIKTFTLSFYILKVVGLDSRYIKPVMNYLF
jgi:hypothetical protein